ncbi:MAG: DUF4062 domain-containing protein [Acidobacteriota bacterium]
MATDLKALRVFLASPSDVQKERRAFRSIVEGLNAEKAHPLGFHLIPIGWEDTVPSEGRPQSVINDDIRTADLVIVLLWRRWGSPTGMFSSGVEEEFDLARTLNRQFRRPSIWIYFRHAGARGHLCSAGQMDHVEAFRDKLDAEQEFLYQTFRSVSQWKVLLRRHLCQWLDKLQSCDLGHFPGILTANGSTTRHPPDEITCSLAVDLRSFSSDWLRADFFIRGPRIGQFGRHDEQNIDRGLSEKNLYHAATQKEADRKPNYFLTYWGWYGLKRSSELPCKEWLDLTVAAITSRLRDDCWVEAVVPPQYTDGALAPERRTRSIRHTAKAAEILMLLGQQPDLVSRVGWSLIESAKHLMNADHGWKEFIESEDISSLWSSVYVFRLLTLLVSPIDAMPVAAGETFRKKAMHLLTETELFIESEWRRARWGISPAMPSDANTPIMLVEYGPLARNRQLVESARQHLLRRVRMNGALTLKNCLPSTYALAIRYSMALALTRPKNARISQRERALWLWLRHNFDPNVPINTCDAAFLSDLLRDYAATDSTVPK